MSKKLIVAAQYLAVLLGLGCIVLMTFQAYIQNGAAFVWVGSSAAVLYVILFVRSVFIYGQPFPK